MARLPRLRRSPSRQVTDTSYSAVGAVGPPNYSEVGSQRAGSIVDPVPSLGNRQQASRTYRKMVRSDASVRISLRAGKAPVLGGEYFIDPFSQDELDQQISEFVEFNLFEGMTTPWLKVLEQILKFYEDGFSVFEPVWELREWSPKKNSPTANRRKYTMLRKMAVRPASTVSKIEYDDNGGPVEIVQQAIDSNNKVKEVRIPIEKAVVFTFDQDGGDLLGNSILRSAYQSWYYKDHLYKIDAIQKERHGIGVPEIVYQPGASEADKKLAHELGANLRTNEKAYIVRPVALDVGFAELSGQLVNALDSAMHHDTMIMKNIMVQFLNAGLDASGGGRATSATSMDMFLKAMRYIATAICDCINMYVIPQLVAYNFKTDRFPQLKVRNIGEAKDFQMWSAGIANLLKQDAIQMDDSTEQWMRKQADMPKRVTPFKEPTAASSPFQPQQDVQGNGNPQPGNVGKSASSGAT